MAQFLNGAVCMHTILLCDLDLGWGGELVYIWAFFFVGVCNTILLCDIDKIPRFKAGICMMLVCYWLVDVVVYTPIVMIKTIPTA